MTRGGEAFRHLRWVQVIFGRDGCSSGPGGGDRWPTPCANEPSRKTRLKTDRPGRDPSLPGNYHQLGRLVENGEVGVEAKRRWPTPMAQDAKNATLPPSQATWDSVPGAILREQEAEKNWPTPRAVDGSKKGPSGGKMASLGTVVRYPEPSVPGSLHRDRLNPNWVEQLMGVPPGWTTPTGPSQRPLAASLMAPLWPAPPGRRQHPGEAPRTHAKADHDRPRLKALGNTIVPQCVFVVGLQLAEAFLDSIRLEGVPGTERADVRALSVEGCAPQSTRRQEGHCGASSESNGALDPPTQRSLQ